MTPDDIVSALEALRALVRDPVTKSYAFRLDHRYFQEYIVKHEKKGYPKINPAALIWTPYVMGRNNQYEDAPALPTVAPREEEETGEVPEEGVQMAESSAQAAAKVNGTTPEVEPVTPGLVSQTSSKLGGYSPTKTAPTTPRTNGIAIGGKPHRILPTQYEIFPAIPGTKSRGPGRPAGSRRRPATPSRRSGSTGNGGPVSPVGLGLASTVRRTRSKLGEVVNGIELGDEQRPRKNDRQDDADSDDDAEEDLAEAQAVIESEQAAGGAEGDEGEQGEDVVMQDA